VAVYVREAHPFDGWTLPNNVKLGISVAQHKDFGDRCRVAETCCSSLKMTIPMVVDAMDDRVGIAFSGMPDRLYIVDTAGRVAYKGGRGPFGYIPSEMEQALVMLLMDESRGRRSAVLTSPGGGQH
jgi:hypothetical protein